MTTTVITDSNRLTGIEKELNIFVQEWGETPFGLPAFLKAGMKICSSKGNQFPAILLTRVDGKLVGLAALAIRRLYGIRYAESLLDFWSATDLVIEDDYRQIVIDHILRTILEKLQCKLAMLYLPLESSYLQNLRQTCKSNKLHSVLDLEPYISHGVVSTEHSWSEFLKFRGRYFQKDLRAIERKLNTAGKWKLALIENNIGCSKEDLYDKIITIEKSSWKEIYRQNKRDPIDETLKWFLDSSNLIIDNNSILKRKIWFLELNDRPIAFSLVLEYKETGFIAKTSFDEKYRKLSPGIFINNIAVKNLFDKRELKRIDFMSSMPIVSTWDPKILPRVRFNLGGRSSIGMLKVRRTIKKIVSELEHSDKTWPFYFTAREQLKKSRKHITW